MSARQSHLLFFLLLLLLLLLFTLCLPDQQTQRTLLHSHMCQKPV